MPMHPGRSATRLPSAKTCSISTGIPRRPRRGAYFGCHAIALALVYSAAGTAGRDAGSILASVLQVVETLVHVDCRIRVVRVGVGQDEAHDAAHVAGSGGFGGGVGGGPSRKHRSFLDALPVRAIPCEDGAFQFDIATRLDTKATGTYGWKIR